VTSTAASGHVDSEDFAEEMDISDARKIAIQYDVGGSDENVAAINVWVKRTSTTLPDGSWTCRIRTDDGGEPSTTLVDDEAVSLPLRISDWDRSFAWEQFSFKNVVTLSANDTVWFEFTGDADYYDNFKLVAPSQFYGNIGSEGATGNHTYGPIFEFDNAGGTWGASPTDGEGIFFLSSLDTTLAYGYVITYVNSTYGIESRQSEEVREVLTDVTNGFTVSTPATSDDQVDKVRLYRREMSSIEDAEADITDAYKFVAEGAEGASFTDHLGTSYLGAELQTQDHYTLDEVADSGSNGRESALLPFLAVYWKGRIIIAEENSRILHFTKRLEKDGRTGQTGQEVVDFFPLLNQQEMPVASDIIGLKVLANDQLAVYFKNEMVWVLRGMNEVLNPPSDIGRYEVLDTVGLFAPASLQTYKERHVYLSSEGVYIFNGTANPEHASNVIQSIFDGIEAANLDDSIMAVYGNEVWVLIDSDNDGALDKFYIVDLQQSELPWREYDYGLDLNDVVVRRTGNTFRSLFAADADSNFIVELEDGTDDNGVGIVAEAETHDIEVGGEVAIGDVALRGFYSNNPSSYEGIITDHLGEEHLFSIEPSSSDDMRGHHAGVRVLSADRLRVKIKQTSTNEDELRAISVRYQSRG
jgi:hypothetical protein